VCAGEVGAVLCLDASRLARNGRDWHHLLELCGLVGARVIDTDGIYDAVSTSVNHLRHGSDIIENLVQNAGLMVVGIEYSLETGVVDFFENMPASREMSVIITRARASASRLFENSTSPAPSLTFVRHQC
jgi:hypothetical protein